MAKKKGKASTRASAFMEGIGTAGGAVGISDGLIGFGAGDLMRQVFYGMGDNNISSKDPTLSAGPMPQDLDSSYLKLNLPGSPLPMNGLTAAQNLQQSIANQDAFLAQYQMAMSKIMPPGANTQLPMGMQPPTPKKKGRR